jgi:methionyl-tRNA synthetase
VERYGVDAVRYFLTRELSSFEDGDFTEEKFKEAYNANLANGLGNLVARILKMSSLYLISPVDIPDVRPMEDVDKSLENFEFNRAMDSLWSLVSELDVLIQEQKPFEVVKKNKETARKQVTYLVKELARLAKHLEPFLPDTSEKILQAIRENKLPEPLFPRKD